MRTTRLRGWILVLTGCFALSALAESEVVNHDWPQYRGPNRDGISTETHLVTEWPEAGPTELFRQPIGAAFSGITVVGDRLYTAESDAEGEFALSLDAATGEQIWRQKIGDLFENSFGNGPRSTPTVVDGKVYVLSGQGVFNALEASDGKLLWQVDFKERFGAETPRFGFSASALAIDDLLIMETHGVEDNAVVALDRQTGELRWGTEKTHSAYSSPIQIEFGGVEQLIFLNSDDLVSVDMSGKVLWSHPFAPGNGVKPAIPIFVEPDLIFVSASYDIGALVVRMQSKEGVLSAEEVWRSRVMRNHFNASVLHEGTLYGFDNSALKAIDAASGQQHWAKRGGLGKGSLLYAEGHLVVLSETGNLMLVEATPEAFRQKAAARVLSGRCWTSPTLSHGRVYVRNREEIVAFDLRSMAKVDEPTKTTPEDAMEGAP